MKRQAPGRYVVSLSSIQPGNFSFSDRMHKEDLVYAGVQDTETDREALFLESIIHGAVSKTYSLPILDDYKIDINGELKFRGICFKGSRFFIEPSEFVRGVKEKWH